jgi:hypothetical protein
MTRRPCKKKGVISSGKLLRYRDARGPLKSMTGSNGREPPRKSSKARQSNALPLCAAARTTASRDPPIAHINQT